MAVHRYRTCDNPGCAERQEFGSNDKQPQLADGPWLSVIRALTPEEVERLKAIRTRRLEDSGIDPMEAVMLQHFAPDPEAEDNAPRPVFLVFHDEACLVAFYAPLVGMPDHAVGDDRDPRDLE